MRIFRSRNRIETENIKVNGKPIEGDEGSKWFIHYHAQEIVNHILKVVSTERSLSDVISSIQQDDPLVTGLLACIGHSPMSNFPKCQIYGPWSAEYFARLYSDGKIKRSVSIQPLRQSGLICGFILCLNREFEGQIYCDSVVVESAVFRKISHAA